MSLAINNNLLSLIPQSSLNNQAKTSAATSETAPLDAAIEVADVSNPARQNVFKSTVTSLQSSVENMAAALYRIRDEGLAQQWASLSQTQFTQQPQTAMLAQANLSAHDVLALLRNN